MGGWALGGERGSRLTVAALARARAPQLFVGKRKPWKGILLYGPPGTGKSFLAKAVATEADAAFLAVSSADLVSKWQGESERLVKNLFEMARAEEHAIIFIDEIDSMCGSRSEGESDSTRRIKTQFLVEMQGVTSGHDGLLVLGATNVPWELDPAIRRRFEKRIYIPLPEPEARAVMFRLNLGDTPHTVGPDAFAKLGEISDGCSGSDISVVVREALMEPLRKCQQAKQFFEVADLTEAGERMLTPCEVYPSCDRCPMALSTGPPPTDAPCAYCHARRTSLYEIASERLKVPMVNMADFEKILERSRTSVAADELDRFTDWTMEFGQEG